MSTPGEATPASGRRLVRAAQVIVVSSVMFSFISYWRTAAVVLCDLASTAYYIGGIVEASIGKAAAFFILAVMLFSFVVRSVYIESCSLFVRGGVYRIVKEAMGGHLARLAVSALMFDYILTGPISGVSAGQYIIGLGLETFAHYGGITFDPATREAWKRWGSVLIACGITLYFFRLNLIGIHESSEKALKIMIATTIMGVIILAWCGLTLAIEGPRNSLTWEPTFSALPGSELEDPLGFLAHTPFADHLRVLSGINWLSVIGLIGLFIAFGHSVLAMSGEETLAQVYREVEAPKLHNFRKAAFIVFIYSLVLTGGISFLAVLLIPDQVRMKDYADNLIGGLAMSVYGPVEARLLLNAFVVVVGSLILAGAVNTAIIGSNGVLNRVAEDGVIPDWFLRPHPRYGTTYRLLYVIFYFQIFTIVASRGDVIILGEAYAFGVVWSFVFMTLAMLVLRFKRPGPREFKVPLNLKIGQLELPIGLFLVFFVLLISAIMNLLTKEVATIGGLAFTATFLTLFTVTEYYHRKKLGHQHEHLEQFNRKVTGDVTVESLHLTRPYRKLVAIRSPQNLFMLERTLAETDPETTDVVVMTAKVVPPGGGVEENVELDEYDQRLMTAVVQKAEQAGKHVTPLIIPTNNALYAVLRTAKNIGAQELVLGASNKFTAEEQLDQMSLYWISVHDGKPLPLTIRLLSRDRDVYLDLEGGSRIPRLGELQAHSVAELRAAGVGVDRVLMIHDGTASGSDLFLSVLTMLDPQVALGVAVLPAIGVSSNGHESILSQDEDRARKLERALQIHFLEANWGPLLVRLAQEVRYDIIILPLESAPPWNAGTEYVRSHAPCKLLFAAPAVIPSETSAD